jgi:radical SAM superfamily enzyme YgiQ (UPF0313 family)
MTKIEKILFAIPNDRWFGNRHWHSFPYTMGILNSVVKDRYDVKVLDASLEDLSPEEVGKRITEYNPDVVGISCMSMEFTRHFQQMASLAKSSCPQTKVVIGGIYPTLLPEILIQNKDIDLAVLGEGEYRLPQLLASLEKENPSFEKLDGLAFKSNGQVIINRPVGYLTDLDALPLPNYDNLDFSAYANKAEKYSYYMHPNRFPYANTITSRGCPFDCVFCSSQAINGPGIRYRSADSVLKEIDWLVEKYGIKELIFFDDNFYLNHKRLDEILDRIIERKYDLEWKTVNAAVYALNDKTLEKMRKSGCYQIALAIESGTPEGLRLLNKPLKLSKVKPIVDKARSLDFQVTGLFVIGTPGETWEQIRETMKFAEDLNLDYCSFNIATPLPKTKLYEVSKRDKLLPEDFSFDSLDFKGFGRATITTEEFTPEELQILRAFEWDRINFKTEEKLEKIAKMHGLTTEEVNQWRVSTRRGLGVRVRNK